MIFTTTERLLLRQPRAEDLDPLVTSWSDPEMTRYTGIRPDVRSFLSNLIADMQSKQPGELAPGGPWYQFVAERGADGALVADLGVGFGIPGDGQVELGYRVLPAFQGQGYGREAVAAIISFLIERHGIHRFVGVAAAKNAGSVALLRSLGFRQEGHFRQSFLCNGEWIDDFYFALLASEWTGFTPPGR